MKALEGKWTDAIIYANERAKEEAQRKIQEEQKRDRACHRDHKISYPYKHPLIKEIPLEETNNTTKNKENKDKKKQRFSNRIINK